MRPPSACRPFYRPYCGGDFEDSPAQLQARDAPALALWTHVS